MSIQTRTSARTKSKPQPYTPAKYENFSINKTRALDKKLEASAAYEVLKGEIDIYFEQHSTYKLLPKHQHDNQGLCIRTSHSVRNRSNNRQLYRINLFHTTSKVEVNGQGMELFLTHIEDIKERMKSRGNYKIYNKQIEEQINIIKRNEVDIEIRGTVNESFTTNNQPKINHINRIQVSKGTECIQNTDTELLSNWNRAIEWSEDETTPSQDTSTVNMSTIHNYCAICNQTAQPETSIDCIACSQLFHYACENIDPARISQTEEEQYSCRSCSIMDMDVLHKAGEAAIPKYRRKIKIKSKGKAIWNEQIDKASKQSKNAFKVWRQHGAPQERSNELKIKMTAAKRILRKAQRQAYASQRESTAGKIMKASNSDTKLFYKLINMQRKTPLINTKILKLNEKTAEDGPSIMNIWQEHFQQLATPTIEENFDTEKLELVEIQNNIIESIEREKGKLWILLRNLYKGMSIKVKWEGQCTEDVMVLQGIQQGAKLSTTLYKCYNNVILDSILKSGLGACIGDIQVPAPTCADDIAVLANSTADAQGILDIVQHHTSRDLVKINPTKSEAVLYNAKGSNISTLKFEDNDINITNETKHLGIKRNEQNRANISERIRTGRATIYSLLGAGLHVRRGFSPMVAYKLWRTYAVPRSIYGLEVMNLLAKEKDMLELAERKILRQIQGLPNNTANMAVYTLVGAEPIAITLDKNVLTFFMNIVRNPGTIECEILRRQIVFSDQRGKDFINRVEKTLSKYNLKSSSYYIENPLNKMEWKRLVGIKIKEYWKNECHNEKMEKTSLKYIEIQNNPLNEAHNIWKSVKNNSKDVKAGEIKARISTQTYIFQAKRAKFDPKVNPMYDLVFASNLNRHRFNQFEVDPSCPMCKQGPEDRTHFLVLCKHLTTVRQPFMDALKIVKVEDYAMPYIARNTTLEYHYK
ncbi:unnamed protein product [Mytilus edulis]|uniref:PHD-type domain-containing protein n=1 Tax=Mytilus edulis TaxID=6550 RepID=A0A8S3TAW8_MYTED|nr:unnamed protein product [Mytilus edulis]